MLNNSEPNEYVLASGVTTTVKDFISMAFKEVGIDTIWENKTTNNLNEICYFMNNGQKVILVTINEKFYRPCEVDLLLGDSTLARKELNWKPKLDVNGLVKKMVNHDYSELIKKDRR